MPILYFFYFVNIFFFKTFFSTSNLIDINSFIFFWLLFFPIPFIDFNTTTNLNIFPFLLFGKPLNFIFIYYRVLRRKLYYLRKFVFISISEGLLSYTSYSLQEFSNAFVTSFLLLGMSKIFYYFIFYVQLTWVYNSLLLLIYFLIALRLNIHFYLRYFTYKFSWLSFGDYFFGLYHMLWEELYENMKQEIIFMEAYQDEDENIKNFPKFKWQHKINTEIGTMLLYMRLWMLTEPLLFLILKSLLMFFLIANKYLILSYVIGIIIILSHFLLLFQLGDVQTMYQILILKDNLLKEGETIKPTYKNARFMLFYITRYIFLHFFKAGQNDGFFIVEKDPKNSFTKNMVWYDDVYENSTSTLDIYWKMKNFHPTLDIDKDIKLEKTKRNEYFGYAKYIIIGITICFVSYYCKDGF